MRIVTKKLFCFLALAAACMTPSLVKADTISATLTGLSPYTFGSVYLQGAGSLNGGVGNILWQGANVNPAPFNGAFNTYCIDLIQDIGFGGNYTFTTAALAGAPKSGAYPGGTPANGMGSSKATEIETLFGMHLSDTQGDSPSANIDREAFQLAIWNVIYDTDTSVSDGSGTFYAISNSGLDASAIGAANGYLTDISNSSNQSQYAVNDLVALIGQNGAQDQVAVNPLGPTPTHDPLPAPLPAAAPVGLLAMAAGAFAKWRQRRLMD